MGDITVLLIEDNKAVTETLTMALGRDYQFLTAGDGDQGLKILSRQRPDIIILDLNLPGISGLNVCKQIRKIGVQAPILILSANDSISTKLELFEAGADDYLVKPISLGELIARLKIVENRLKALNQDPTYLKTPNLVLDHVSQTVIREGGQAIELRRKEYAILEYLIKNAGETVSRRKLASQVWGHPTEPWSNTVDVHIKYLRDKIDKPYKKPLITTVHGLGYRLEAG